VLLSPEDLAALRITQRGSLIRRGDATRSGVRPPEVENRDAERYFHDALDADPAFDEARVRLARLYEVRGKYADAAAELARANALRAGGDPIVSFYRELFAGRADRALGKMNSAAAHFQSALNLFPHAQSALLAASQLALLRADVPAALGPVRSLRDAATANQPRVDPWWVYGAGLGRNADALLRELWAAARAR
jgi:tetratricopeptide (TPR) repeat protein